MNNIMVCVTRQKTCQRLIDCGKALMENEQDQLFVIHVAGEDEKLLGDKAKEAGASLTVERSSDVLRTLISIADKNQANRVVVGESGEGEAGAGFLHRLEKKLSGRAKLIVVPAVS